MGDAAEGERSVLEIPEGVVLAWGPSFVPKRVNIRIVGSEGQELLAITETPEGRLDVTGDEANWTEAARRFIDGLREMAARM
jgi:hypothetical protein